MWALFGLWLFVLSVRHRRFLHHDALFKRPQSALFAFRKSVIAVAKLRTFDIPLSVIANKSDGYEKPERAHTANTKNIPARENIVYFDRFVKGDNVRSESVEISTRKRGKKKSSLNSVGAGGTGGYVLAMTIRSNGSSNIIGPAAVPTKALPRAIFSP